MSSIDQPGERYSLGRPVDDDTLTGSWTGERDGCASANCTSQLRHYRPGMFITRKMYVESGIKEMKFQMCSGCAVRGRMNKLSVAHANDLTVFHSMIRYDQQGHGNADYRCLLLFKGVSALCNKVLEVYPRET